ncbi:MAG: type I restriction endonuclease [Phycisphaerales bacterium]
MFERLSSLAERLDQVRSDELTEEATKTAMVLPFIRELGYDIFNPGEVIPEFTADVGIKKGEKVDYAILKDGTPIILFECKPCGARLESYSSQLYRYFSVTNARIAILTDGVRYQFFSDLIEPNKLDSKPFLTINLDRLTQEHAERVTPFTKDKFDLTSVIADAELLYAKSQIREHFARELNDPSPELIRHFADPVHAGPMRQNVIDRYKTIVRSALNEHISSAVDSRLRSALLQNSQNDSVQASEQTPQESSTKPLGESDEVVTTEEELNGYYIVKAILRDLVEPKRIVARDVQSYFGVLLDDNNRKPICRLHFNRSKKYLGVFDEKKQENKLHIESVDDLFKHADAIRKSLQHAIGS